MAPHNDWIVDIPSEKYQKPEIILYEVISFCYKGVYSLLTISRTSSLTLFMDRIHSKSLFEMTKSKVSAPSFLMLLFLTSVSGILSVQKEPVAQQLPNYGKAFNTQVAHKCLYIHSTGTVVTKWVVERRFIS